MANSLRFRALRPVIVFSFCFLVIFLRPNVSSATRDKYRGPGPHDDYVHVTALDGESGGATLGVDGRSELCNIDMSSFLPPPYNNISGMVCSPVWNNFILRVSQIKFISL